MTYPGVRHFLFSQYKHEEENGNLDCSPPRLYIVAVSVWPGKVEEASP